MSFASPLLLLFLLLVPLAVVGLVLLERRRDRRASAWAPAPLLANMVSRPPVWRRVLPTALLLVGVALLLVGFARPREKVHVSTQEATLVLVVDVSGSMASHDVQPSRIAVARAVAQRFADALPHGYRIALLTFSDHAALVVPPTHDTTLVRAALNHARTGPQGTALADAVVRAVAVAKSVRGEKKGHRPPATIVLLSDGGQTAGRVTPQVAATQARQAGIPVNTVLVGTPDGIVTQQLQGGFSERIQVPAQGDTLKTVARLSGGRYAPAAHAVAQKAIYAELGSRVGRKRKTVEVTAAAAAGGLVFMLLGGLLSGAWFRRIP